VFLPPLSGLDAIGSWIGCAHCNTLRLLFLSVLFGHQFQPAARSYDRGAARQLGRPATTITSSNFSTPRMWTNSNRRNPHEPGKSICATPADAVPAARQPGQLRSARDICFAFVHGFQARGFLQQRFRILIEHRQIVARQGRCASQASTILPLKIPSVAADAAALAHE